MAFNNLLCSKLPLTPESTVARAVPSNRTLTQASPLFVVYASSARRQQLLV